MSGDFRIKLDQTDFPVGAKMAFGGFRAPSGGWLLLDGSTISRTTYAALFAALTLSTTGNTTSGSATISNIPAGDVSVIDVGMPITGTGIPAGATVLTIASSTSITISATATATNTGTALIVYACGVGDGSTTFGLADARQKFPLGKAGSQGVTGSRLGSAGGSIDHTHNITTGSQAVGIIGLTGTATPPNATYTSTANNPPNWVVNWIIKY